MHDVTLAVAFITVIAALLALTDFCCCGLRSYWNISFCLLTICPLSLCLWSSKLPFCFGLFLIFHCYAALSFPSLPHLPESHRSSLRMSDGGLLFSIYVLALMMTLRSCAQDVFRCYDPTGRSQYHSAILGVFVCTCGPSHSCAFHR